LVFSCPALLVAAAMSSALAADRSDSDAAARFKAVVARMIAEPYQPNYVPTGDDSAFPGSVRNDAPAEDYTSGSIPGNPDSPAWPPWFKQVLLKSGDGAPLLGELALHPGKHPAVLVVHGFNTHGYQSVIRWAAMLYANGYNVLAADQRDYSFEYAAGYGYPKWLQTFGWKESEDVQAAGRYLAGRSGVTSVGVTGFSEGAQNTVLALALDARSHSPVFAAGLTFSGPADQNTQIYTTAEPSDCATPHCTYPATDALVAVVVPPYDYTDVCTAIDAAATYYKIAPFAMMAREIGFHAQADIAVPLLNFYTADDSLVPAFEATMTAGYEAGNPVQETLELQRGEHAYFFDRWWQQKAILLYFKSLLPGAATDASIHADPTVNRTSGGATASSQLVALGKPTRKSADAQRAPFVCNTALGPL
jgi:dienelactone hydrolase